MIYRCDTDVIKCEFDVRSLFGPMLRKAEPPTPTTSLSPVGWSYRYMQLLKVLGKKITNLHLPGGHGVRLDTHVYSGYIIPPNYDSMIAKLIVTAQNRIEAIEKMRRALDEFVIEGIKTTIPFHRQLMDDPRYVSGDYTTKFMEDFKIK